MGQRPKRIPLVKFFSGIILSQSRKMDDCLPAIEAGFGPVDFRSGPMEFCRYSTYYNREMGDNLLRYFVAFRNLGDRTRLPEMKRKAIALEEKFSLAGKRTVNLDPGYMTLGQVFLASTKDNFFRIYLSDGIFAEVTLYFKGGHYLNFPYTYPDYADTPYHEELLKIRAIYREQLDTSQGAEAGPESE
jgi:hypothetical protein